MAIVVYVFLLCIIFSGNIGGGKLIGCFKPSDELEEASLLGKKNSAATCLQVCEGKKYAGVSGDKCLCGDRFGSNGDLKFSHCEDKFCPGGEQNYCGGDNAWMIFETQDG